MLRVLLTTTYVASLYGFIFIARDVVLFFRERNLLRVSVALAGVLTLVGIFLLIVRKLGATRTLAARLILGIGAFYLVALYEMERPEERFHYIQYGILSPLVVYSLRPYLQGRGLYLFSVALAMFLGAMDEVIQSFVPSRVFEWKDLFFNMTAAVFGMGFYLLIKYFVKREHRFSESRS